MVPDAPDYVPHITRYRPPKRVPPTTGEAPDKTDAAGPMTTGVLARRLQHNPSLTTDPAAATNAMSKLVEYRFRTAPGSRPSGDVAGWFASYLPGGYLEG